MAEHTRTVRITELADTTPLTVGQREEREGVRVRYLARHNGTGLEIGKAFYQVKHNCGKWAWADSAYCQHCGHPVELTDELRAAVFPDPARRPAQAPPARPPDPPGSFSNPRTGPVPARQAGIGGPAAAGPDPAPFNDDPRAKAAMQTVLDALKARETTPRPTQESVAPSEATGQAEVPPRPTEALPGPASGPEGVTPEGAPEEEWDPELDRLLREAGY